MSDKLSLTDGNVERVDGGRAELWITESARRRVSNPRRFIRVYRTETSQMDEKWYRVRFYANAEDYRPVKFPPPGPYWCSGYGEDHSVIVAYVKKISQILTFWPEATALECLQENVELEFNSRFQEPEWWKEIQSQSIQSQATDDGLDAGTDSASSQREVLQSFGGEKS